MVLSARRLGATAALVATLASRAAALSCTDAETTATETAYTEYASTLDTDCDPDACSSACVATMSNLAEHLPDCEYTDGVNYYAGMVEGVALCAQAASESGSAAGSISADEGGSMLSMPSSESGSESAFESGSALGSEGSGAAGCSTSESADTGKVLDTYDSQYTEACSSDECSSACLAVLTELVAALPDCIDADGVNYYEGVQLIVDSCGSASASEATDDRGSDSDSSLGQFESRSMTGDASVGSSSGSNDASAPATAMAALATASALAAASLVL